MITAASVARDYFLKEIEAHNHLEDTANGPDVAVILHDACYGHRHSRPRTSKLGLATIVERPERIHAIILGLSTAYVRLGGFHSEAANALHPKKEASSVQSMPFRIRKSSRAVPLTSQAVTNVHGVKWMEELSTMCGGAEAKLALTGKELTRPPAPTKSEEEDRPKLHEGDLYLCSESLDALQGALAGVCDAVDAVFTASGPRRAFACVRPPGHHCSADYPSGFCWLNNVHVGISHASLTYGLTHAVIVDFDLHHGDGSQSITWAHNTKVAKSPKSTPASKKAPIGYFSLHDINSYPCEDGDEEKVQNASLCIENAHGQTIWNVHLQPWKNQADFWQLYEERYSVLISKARAFLRLHYERLRNASAQSRPTAAIFISAGFDASEWESQGMQRHKVNVPTDFYARFTRDIVSMANEPGLGVDGRVISILEGGYSDRALTSGILSHLCGLITPRHESLEANPNGLGIELVRRIGNLDVNDQEKNGSSQSNTRLSSSSHWWSRPHLEELETLVNPAPPVAVAKKPKSNQIPTYSTPTESFTAKIVNPPQGRRSYSSSTTSGVQRASSGNFRMPSPPPPDVDWATAANELSKVLIPTDRQTTSCKPEDLNAEASKVRRNRQSTIGVKVEEPSADAKRMQLRDRKTRLPNTQEEDEDPKSAPRASRRKTIAGAASLEKDTSERQNSPTLPASTEVKAPMRRRSSVSSSIMSSAANPVFPPGLLSHQSTNSDAPSISMERRLSTSSSIRPSSSISNRVESTVLKKARAPTAPRTELSNSKARAIKKPPVMLRVPSSNSKAVAPGNSDVVQTNGGESTTSGAPTRDVDKENLDNLVSGVKKMSIKLHVKPKDDAQAADKKKKPIGRPPKTTKPTVDRKPQSTASSTPSTNGLPQQVIQNSEVPSVQPAPTVTSILKETKSPDNFTQMSNHPLSWNPHPASFAPPDPSPVLALASDLPSPPPQPLGPSTSEYASPYQALPQSAPIAHPPPTQPESHPRQHAPQFIPPPPPQFVLPSQHPSQSHPAAQTGPQTVTLQMAPPQQLPSQNGFSEPASSQFQFSAPSPITPKRIKQDMPVFTSTTPIKFGQMTGAPASKASAQQNGLTGHPGPINGTGRDGLNGMKAERDGYGNEKREEKELDIWVVPETPQPPPRAS